MKKLGQILVEEGWLAPAKVNQALQHQQIFGGRLGTCLLELNLISEERLGKALVKQCNAPLASVEDLRSIPEPVLQMVPSRMAYKSKVIPFDRYSTEARVAMISTQDLILQDELAFVTSKRLKIYVAPEIRILEALEKHYGCDIDQRYQRIWDRLNRARYLWQDSPTVGRAPGTPEAAQTRPESAELPTMEAPPSVEVGHQKTEWSPEAAPHLEQPALVAPPTGPSAEEKEPEPEPAPTPPPPAVAPPVEAAPPTEPPTVVEPPAAVEEVAPPEPKPLPSSAQEESVSTRPMPSMTAPETEEGLERLMMEVEERDHIAHALVLYLSERFGRVLCFMVRGDEVAGWMGTGRDVDESLLEGFRLDFDSPSLFLNIKAGVPIYRGPVPRMEAHEQLVQIWGGRYPRECILVPVHIKGRLVAVLYLDKGGRALGGVDLGEVQRIGRLTGRAFEAFLVRRKQR